MKQVLHSGTIRLAGGSVLTRAVFLSSLFLLISLTAFGQLTGSVSGPPNVCQGSVAVVTFSGAGGTTPYTFSYTINEGAELTVTTSGSDTSVTVTVSTGDSGTYTYDLIRITDSIPETQTLSSSTEVVVHPVPGAITANLTQPTCGSPTGIIEVTSPLGGTIEYSLDGLTWVSTPLFSGLAADSTYIIYVRDVSVDATCVSSASFGINAVPDAPPIPVTAVNCSLGSSNAIVSILSPLGEEYEYRLNDGEYQSSTLFANVVNGSYTVTVRNTDGCETTGDSFDVSCDCIDGPTLTLSSTSGATCGTTPITVSDNEFGGTATIVTITTDGTGIVDPTSTTNNPFSFTYIPGTEDIGGTVTITVTTNNPLGEPCVAATATYTLTVNTIPFITGTTDASRCGAGTVILGAVASGGTINWYAELAGGEPLASGTNFTTPVINTTTTYFVDATENGCTTTERSPVIATINLLPAAIAGDNRAIMKGQNTLIGASAVVGNSYSWTSEPEGFISDEANPTVMPSVTTTYTLIETVVATGCTNSNSVVVTVLPLPESFIPVWWPGNGIEHMNIYVVTAMLDGSDLQPGDAVGVFDGTICVGAAVVTEVLTGSNYLSINVSLDDPDTPETDGFISGNPITFRIWDSSEDIQPRYVDASYVTGEGIFSEGATAVLNLSAFNLVEQSISLQEGWNILSFAAEPDNMSMLEIVDPLIEEGTLIKVQDETGNAIEELPPPLGWINNIGLMIATEGYKIRVRGSTTLNVSGRPVGSSLNIPLIAGWNIIGYPFMSSQPALDAFEQLIVEGSLLKVQDEQGNAIEQLPFPIGWVDNIHDLEPGEGYKVRTSVNTTLTLSDVGGGGKKGTVSKLQPTHFNPVYTGNGLDHMNLYIMNPTINGLALKPGDEIGVFDGGICVGVAVIDNLTDDFIVVNASIDDPTTEIRDGFAEGNKVELRAWSNLRQQEMTSREITILKGYPDRFVKSGTSVMNVDFRILPEVYLSDAYPNPSDYKTNFNFVLGRTTNVRLEIINSTGKLIDILVDDELSEGTYLIEWYNKTTAGNKVLPGIYHYRLITETYTMSKTLIIQ